MHPMLSRLSDVAEALASVFFTTLMARFMGIRVAPSENTRTFSAQSATAPKE